MESNIARPIKHRWLAQLVGILDDKSERLFKSNVELFPIARYYIEHRLTHARQRWFTTVQLIGII